MVKIRTLGRITAVLACLLGAGRAWAVDTDGDGVPDGTDVCCNTPPGIMVDLDGRPLGDLDFDCDVDLMDFAIMTVNMTGPLAPVSCPGCTDLTLNGNETDVDCGGVDCPPCANGLNCLAHADCQSAVCQAGVCQAPSCLDSVQNGDETDIDCGGSCPPCANGLGCVVAVDCQSLICQLSTCQSPSCTDTVQNGSETDVDCGGGSCPLCANGLGCAAGSDCQSTICMGGFCTTLGNGSACTMFNQCASGFCVDGYCCDTACVIGCHACDLPDVEGTCTQIPAGQDPHDECTGAMTCDAGGTCS